MKSHLLYFLSLVFLISCDQKPDSATVAEWKSQIQKVERAFADSLSSTGLPKAFLHFADENAVLLRNNKLILGKESMAKSFEKNKSAYENIELDWTPDYVDVSSSGDMAYTYGKYVFTSYDSMLNPLRDTGIFHTIWKRQDDGEWKFVWD